MKKGLVLFALFAIFVACSDDDDKTVEEEAVEEEIIEQPTDNPDDDSEVETDPVSITATIPTWHHNRQVAVCLTFDDGCENQFTIAQPILDEYDINATFYVVFNNYLNYTYLSSALAAGHEIGCHTTTYSSLTDFTAEEMEADFATCKELMNDNLGVQMLTLAYPNCVNPGNYDLLEKYFIAARTCDCRVDSPTPTDYMNISSWAIGDVTTYTTAESVENIIKKGLTTGNGDGWVTILIHEIDTGSGYSPFSSEELRGVIEFLVANSDVYYVDTFANIARYTKERDAAQVSATMTDDQVVVTLTCNLDEDIYNVPISVEVPLPESWTTVTATQNGTAIDAEIVDNTIIFEAVPNGSEVIITE